MKQEEAKQRDKVEKQKKLITKIRRGSLITNSLLSEPMCIHHSYRVYGIFRRNSPHTRTRERVYSLSKLVSFVFAVG